MKNVKGIFSALLLMFALVLNATTIQDFSGEWESVDANEKGLKEVTIKEKDKKTAAVKAYGACQSTSCGWGTKTGDYFYSSGAGHYFISANYRIKGKLNKQIVMRREGNLIIAKVVTSEVGNPKTSVKYHELKRKGETPIQNFSGIWVNKDPKEKALTQMIVKIGSSSRPSVSSTGMCISNTCHWGNENATYFFEPSAGHSFISVNYKLTGGITKQIVMRRKGAIMVAKVVTTYQDGRKTKVRYYDMVKK